MARDITINARAREGRGRSEAARLRADGELPGVIYGPGIEPMALAVPRSDLLKTLHAHGAHPLVTVKVADGPEYLALVKDLQIDAVKQTALHVDFHWVREDRPVQTRVEVILTGTAAGTKVGGILDVITRDLAIEALPRALPESIEFDVSDMEIGDVARVGDLVAPDGVTILTDAEETLCSVVAPRVEEEVTLTPEELEALAELSPEDLEALQELAEAAPEAEAEVEGEAAAEAEGAEAGEGGEEG
jgi:large subunit ribosomal protein L25